LGEAHRAILKAGSFCVNVLGDNNQAIADRFAGRGGLAGAEKFTEEGWGTLTTGAPTLFSALVSVDCEVVETVSAHTHTVFFGEVMAVRVGAQTNPLVHFDRKYRDLK
jgi:flavin reductase (DIM6/NTAB) family NADH-FMN oxidoreductase RutF